jgi:addiction module HigA family antidote
MQRLMKPSHPGPILAEQMEHLGLKVMPFAKVLGITRQHLHKVLKGNAPLSADLAVKLGHIFGNGPRIWLAMQSDYDAYVVSKKLARTIEKLPVYA